MNYFLTVYLWWEAIYCTYFTCPLRSTLKRIILTIVFWPIVLDHQSNLKE